jgi:hypothetical protein
MDKNLIATIDGLLQQLPTLCEPLVESELSELQLALVGGGIGDTIL